MWSAARSGIWGWRAAFPLWLPSAAALAVLALAASACGLAGRSSPPAAQSTAGPAAATAPGQAARSPEKARLKLGLAGQGIGALPIYLAAERTFATEGLEVEVVGFNGGAPLASALASDSVDISLMALSSVINMIEAGQSVKAFYAGFNQADFAWFGGPGVGGWSDLRGRRIAVGSHGDVTDVLTRYVLRKHGLEPEQDVAVVGSGGSMASLQGLKAGVLEAAILAPPIKFQAQADGLVELGTQASELTATWPKNVLAAKERMLDEQPGTVGAVARAVAAAIRLAKDDREAAIRAIMRVLQYERPSAERAYEDAIGGYDERGLLPAEAMPLFWEVGLSTGQPGEAWAESRFFDRRYIDGLAAAARR